MREGIKTETELGEGYYSIGKVLYYHGSKFDENDWRPVQEAECFKLCWEYSPEQRQAYKLYLDDIFNRYKQARSNRSPEQIAEERYEMRAAFGKGEEVVNIITGERFRT
jgi:hypothetical protein